MHLGHKLKRLRLDNNLSQKEFSRITGVLQSNLSAIENGKHQISLKKFIELAEKLDKKVEIIISDK